MKHQVTYGMKRNVKTKTKLLRFPILSQFWVSYRIWHLLSSCSILCPSPIVITFCSVDMHLVGFRLPSLPLLPTHTDQSIEQLISQHHRSNVPRITHPIHNLQPISNLLIQGPSD